jgi:hypothetical protein
VRRGVTRYHHEHCSSYLLLYSKTPESLELKTVSFVFFSFAHSIKFIYLENPFLGLVE